LEGREIFARFWRRRIKSAQEKLLDVLGSACKIFGPASMVIVSTYDGLLVGFASNKQAPEVNEDLVAGLLTLLWRTGNRLSRDLGIGSLDHIRIRTKENNIYVYPDNQSNSFLLTVVTATNVAPLIIEGVSNSIIKKISNLLRGE